MKIPKLAKVFLTEAGDVVQGPWKGKSNVLPAPPSSGKNTFREFTSETEVLLTKLGDADKDVGQEAREFSGMMDEYFQSILGDADTSDPKVKQFHKVLEGWEKFLQEMDKFAKSIPNDSK